MSIIIKSIQQNQSQLSALELENAIFTLFTLFNSLSYYCTIFDIHYTKLSQKCMAIRS